MKNNIDQFFKDKLESHTLPPAEEAWTKVEANLSKKNNFVVWRIAAAILIAGALVSVIIWLQQGVDNKPSSVVANNSPKDHTIKVTPAPQVYSIEKKAEVRSLAKKSSVNPVVSPPTENKSHQEELQETIVEPKENAIALVNENVQEEKINSKATPPTTIASTHQKPIKLEFTLEDFSSEQPVATVNEEKSSGLKKVWNLAREVKNGDGPVHEIKNELFALNFKKNKNQ